LAAVRGEDRGGRTVRTVVDDHGQVGPAALLQPGHHAGGAEPPRRGHTHGATPIPVSPSSSGSPRARLALWTAPPAVPLVRLSSAPTTTILLAASSSAS